MLSMEGKSFVDVQMIASIIAILFYSYILYLMLTSDSKVMKSSFFRIYIVTGVCDILGILALEWVRAEMKTSFGPAFELLTRLAMTMTGINFFTLIFGCFLMTMNRFTAVCFPHRHHDIWCSRNVCALLILDIALSIMTHIEALLMKFIYKMSDDGGWIRIGRDGSVNRVRIIGSALTTVYEVASIILISYTIYLMNRQLRQSGHGLTQDMGLVFVTAINCIMSVFECIYDISFLFNFESPVILWITDQYDINFFLVMTTNAYSIFFLSHSLRQEFLKRWWSSKDQLFQTTARTM